MAFQVLGIANCVALLLSVRQSTKGDEPVLLVPLVRTSDTLASQPFAIVLTGKALIPTDCFETLIGEFCSYFHIFCPNVTAFFRADSDTLEFMPTRSARGKQSKAAEELFKLANIQYDTERSRMK